MILFNGNIVPVTFETCVTAINLVLLVISFFIESILTSPCLSHSANLITAPFLFLKKCQGT
tara:strand:+ start:401 stop:583 length:183 start_codon:yes stop_codon:yes gene_type:complete